MDYEAATAPTATIEKIGVRCEPWQTVRTSAGNRVEVTTMPAVGLAYWYLRRVFVNCRALQNDSTLSERLWPRQGRDLRRDYCETSRDYCVVLAKSEKEILAWVVIVQTNSPQSSPLVKRYSVTCLWPNELPVGKVREHSIELVEDIVRLYIEKVYVQDKSRGIPIGDDRFAPVFAADAPLRFVWPQIDAVH